MNIPLTMDDLDGLRARVLALEKLLAVTRELTVELDHETLLKKILRAAMEVSHSTAGSLLLYDAAAHELVFKVVLGGGGDVLKNTRVPVTQGIAGESFSRQQAVVVDDAEKDSRYFRAPATSVGMTVHQLIAVPLRAQGQPMGVLEVMNKSAGERYTPDDVELLMAFAAQSAIALENARLYSKVLEERDRILAVEAAVRHELARDLHDGPAQLLAALVMETRHLRDAAKNDVALPPDEFVQLEAVATRALYQTRNILFDLRPVILEQQGLRAAFEQYVLRLRMVEPFKIHLQVATLQTRFEPKKEAAIFSIAQEAVNNAKKHAQPNNLWIEAQEDERELKISVRDDGRGFDVTETEATYTTRSSLGLLNMRERAEMVMGSLKIDSQPGMGTTVTLVVPLSTI
jgi:signal transduction histidine kinase